MTEIFLVLWSYVSDYTSLMGFVTKCQDTKFDPNLFNKQNLWLLKDILNVICTYIDFENMCLMLSIVYFKST